MVAMAKPVLSKVNAVVSGLPQNHQK
jgi:hypothetical protein